jgi:mevalonate kinase
VTAQLEKAAQAIVREVLGGDDCVEITLESTLPRGVGLGSSAALCVAIARAVGGLAGIDARGVKAIPLASVGETAFHTTPSGIDAACAARGELLWFRRGKMSEAIHVPGSLKLVVAIADASRATGAVVEAVAARRASRPDEVASIFRAIGDLSLNARRALELRDNHQLGILMNENHGLLSALGVSTQGLDRVQSLLLDSGALGAKLTGAGGGGCVIALAPGCEADVERKLKALGVDDVFTVTLSP